MPIPSLGRLAWIDSDDVVARNNVVVSALLRGGRPLVKIGRPKPNLIGRKEHPVLQRLLHH
ncbi:MAG TPA: hypothetical protein VNU19_09170 [Candidatus Acidoferrum sp.]|nr:hypothetical protein [Candidatus Acidoferrum sp.]